MLRKLAHPFITLPFVLVSQLANAFVDPPTLSPASPAQGQTVSVNFTAGQCDAFPLLIPNNPQITQTGNSIHFLIYADHASDQQLCIYPTVNSTWVVGIYTAGSYTVQVDRAYPLVVGNKVETLGIFPLIVTAAPTPATLPTIGRIGFLVLVGSILLIAIAALRYRQRDRSTTNT
jgi:hypothetical protein